MLGSDTSVDPDDLVNELKTDLVLLNGTLKKLDPDVDLWEVLRPLLAENGTCDSIRSETREAENPHGKN
jgi:hypothetical protein